MTKTISARGTIHGRRIELERDLELPDGQSVTVTVTPPVPPRDEAFEAFKNSLGSLEHEAEAVDEFIKWNREQRHCSRPRIME